KSRWITVIDHGTARCSWADSSVPGLGAKLGSALPENRRNRKLETKIAITAFQPKFCSIKRKSQFQWFATIMTGGAAKWVRVPPTEMFTKRRPSVEYFRRSLGCRL